MLCKVTILAPYVQIQEKNCKFAIMKIFSSLESTVLMGLCVTAIPGWAQKSETTTAAKPNIIYIMCDDMGYGDLGCYGQKYISTPHIDNMASEGMRFTQAMIW